MILILVGWYWLLNKYKVVPDTNRDFKMELVKVNIEVFGTFDGILSAGNGTISISSNGILADIELVGDLSHNMSGKVSAVGNISIGYNMSGKVSSIGNVSVGYNMSGKVSSIGNIFIGYNMAGKVSSIGNISIGYNMSGKVSSIGNNSIGYNMSGKVSSGSRVTVFNDITFTLKGGFWLSTKL